MPNASSSSLAAPKPPIVAERAGDLPAIENLLDRTFGPLRTTKTTYRLRDGVAPLRHLGLVAWHRDRLVGTIRFWPALLRPQAANGHDAVATPVLLLGPLAVEPTMQGTGLGGRLLAAGCALADECHPTLATVLVGDLALYARADFAPVAPRQWLMPGPVDYDRLLVRKSTVPSILPSSAVLAPVSGFPATMSIPAGWPEAEPQPTAAEVASD